MNNLLGPERGRLRRQHLHVDVLTEDLLVDHDLVDQIRQCLEVEVARELRDHVLRAQRDSAGRDVRAERRVREEHALKRERVLRTKVPYSTELSWATGGESERNGVRYGGSTERLSVGGVSTERCSVRGGGASIAQSIMLYYAMFLSRWVWDKAPSGTREN